MRMESLLVALAFVAVPLGAGERIKLHVSPATGFAPADVVVQTIVESDSENRSLEVVAESEDFFRRSEMPLDGENAPRVNSIRYQQMPAGLYDVRVRVLSGNRHVLATAVTSVTIIDR